MATQLRDGTTVEDPRLDRLIEFDERSRDYPVRALFQAEEPASKWWALTTVLDQGHEGACVGFCAAHELLATPEEVLTVEGMPVDGAFARETIYWEAQRLDEWEGGAYPDASPFYEGTSILAGMKVLEALGVIQEYRWAFGAQDVVQALSEVGPVMLGIPWYEGMYTPDENRYIAPTGRLAGGHAILAIAWDADLREVWVHNSWGKEWGLDGRARMTFDTLERLLSEQGEAVVPLVRVNPDVPDEPASEVVEPLDDERWPDDAGYPLRPELDEDAGGELDEDDEVETLVSDDRWDSQTTTTGVVELTEEEVVAIDAGLLDEDADFDGGSSDSDDDEGSGGSASSRERPSWW